MTTTRSLFGKLLKAKDEWIAATGSIRKRIMTIPSQNSDSGRNIIPQMAERPPLSTHPKDEWIAALVNEDCREILRLLGNSRELLGTTWKGRTALHIGARRGCLDLVKKIMQNFDSEGRLSWNTTRIGETLSNPRFDFHSLIQESFLVAEDPEYQLDALAMAIVNGNRRIIHALVEGSLLLCPSNPFAIKHPDCEMEDEEMIRVENNNPGTLLRRATMIVLKKIFDWRSRDVDPLNLSSKVSEIVSVVTERMSACSAEAMSSLKKMYKKHRDFNFLSWDLYLFQFTFVSKAVNFSPKLMKQIRDKICEMAREQATDTHLQVLVRFLCEMQDGQGRTALHIAVDEGTVKHFLAFLHDHPDIADRDKLLSTADGVGRTPLHRAAAIRNWKSLHHLLGNEEINVNEPLQLWQYALSLTTETGIDLHAWSKRNRFRGFGYFHLHDKYTALHVAILHRRKKNVETLLDDRGNSHRRPNCALDLNFPFSRFFELRSDATEGKGKGKRLNLGVLQLAALVGDLSIFQHLFRESLALDEGIQQGRELIHSQWNPGPAIHIIAGAGRCDLLSMIMDNQQQYDCSVVDLYGNNALHHAAKGMDTIFDTHLIDYINCDMARDSRKQKEKSELNLEESAQRALVERQRCVEILLEAGFDVWTTNNAKQRPYPGPQATSEFLAWWFNKLTKETTASQKMYNAAANAISVTAILVATASYVGPFQPPNPLEVANNPTSISWFLKMYVVCETLAFYLAIASVMVALMTSLPVPQESMVDELRRTKKRVTVAVGLLFPSIVCLLLDFGSASIIVIVTKKSQGLTIATACLGGLICLIVSFLFSIRLLRLIFYRNPRIKKLFRSVNF